MIVPRQNTPATRSEVAAAILQAGAPPAAVDVLLAQWDLETGGGSQMYNWNAGNIICAGYPTCNSGGPHSFRAYPDLVTGIADWFHQLQRVWPQAWAGAMAGDPNAFAAGLFADPSRTYAEEGLARYSAGYLARYHQIAGKTVPSPISVPFPWGTVAMGLGLGAAAFAAFDYYEKFGRAMIRSRA